VVGVIASLALFFIMHIALKPVDANSLLSRLDVAALALALMAAVALLRYKASVIHVITACALAGLVLRLAGWA
jgi:chromate transporter